MIDCVWFNDFICVHRNGDVERILQRNCVKGKKGNRVFIANTANHPEGYNHVEIKGKTIKRHRLIAYCFQNLDLADKKAVVDHIDRNPLNNSNENLRIVTHQQNAFNTAVRGTTYRARVNKWEAGIKINGKKIYLGYYSTEAEAHDAYLAAKLIHHVI